MGIFDDFNINIDEVKEGGFSNPDDGVYRFAVASAERRDGSSNHPDNTYVVIEYALEDENGDSAGNKQEWFTIAVDDDPEKYPATISIPFLKARLLSLGLRGNQLAGFDGSEIEGITGTLQLRTRPGKNGKDPSQNVYNVRPDDQAEPEEKPKAKKAAAPKAKAKVAQAPVEEPDEDDDDNPFGN